MIDNSLNTTYTIPRLPSGPTHKEIKIATVDDSENPFDLMTNIYLPINSTTEPTPLLIYIHEQSQHHY